MKSTILWLANIVALITPQTRLFNLRSILFKYSGVKVSKTAKICGTVRIHYNNCKIGNETWIGAGCHLIPTSNATIKIGNKCDLGPNVLLVTGSHKIGNSERRAGLGTSHSITIGDGTWVGAGSTFIAGSSVGPGCVIAAGTLVNDSFPSNVLVAGVPGKIVKTLDI